MMVKSGLTPVSKLLEIDVRPSICAFHRARPLAGQMHACLSRVC